MFNRDGIIEALFGLVVGIVIGLSAGWGLWHQKPAKLDPFAKEARQKDGSLALERTPDSAPGSAPHEIPRGGKEERRVYVTVRPKAPAALPVNGVCPACPPVSVDLSLIRMPDKTRRVVASSTDGRVISGVDIPIEPRYEPREIRWAALGGYDPINRTWAARIDREAGPFRLSIDAYQQKPTGIGAHAWVGVRW